MGGMSPLAEQWSYRRSDGGRPGIWPRGEATEVIRYQSTKGLEHQPTDKSELELENNAALLGVLGKRKEQLSVV